MLKYIQKHKQKIIKYTKFILLGLCLIGLLSWTQPVYALAPLIVWGIVTGIVALVGVGTYYILPKGGSGSDGSPANLDIDLSLGEPTDIYLKQLIQVFEKGTSNIGSWLLSIAGGIIILMIIWGGFQYTQGNTEGGKKTILAAIIGLIIILFAGVIINLVVGLLRGTV